MKILFDTSAFIALSNARDANHQSAAAYLASLTSRDSCQLSRDVFDETATHLGRRHGHRTAVDFVDRVLQKGLFELVKIDDEAFFEAIHAFKRYAGQGLSFTDCTTLALYRRDRFDAIFTFDSDFTAVGARTVPDHRFLEH